MIYISGLKYTISENPENDIWDLIEYYLNKSRLKKLCNYDYSKNTIDTMKTYFLQSKELFNAAITSSIKTAPLLQFYSLSTLTKIIIAKNQRKNFETLKNGHGLKFIVDDLNKIDLSNFKVKIQKGIFYELIKVFLREDSEKYLDAEISFKDLINHNFDIYDHLLSPKDIIPICDFDFQKDKKDNLSIIRLIGKDKSAFENIINNYPQFDLSKYKTGNIIRVDVPGYPIFLNYKNMSDLPCIIMEKNHFGEPFMDSGIASRDNKLLFYQIEKLYMITFILSNLVRYYPSIWNKLITSSNDFWIIEKTIKITNRSFPNYLLNLLSEVVNVISYPGILNRIKYNTKEL